MRFYFKSVFPGLYHVISVTYRIVAYHPLQALTLLLFFQGGTRSANAGTQQCPLEENKISFEMMCYPEDELYQYYYIKKNAPFKDVKYFIFGELHDNRTHHELKARFVNQLAVSGDSVLFEGVVSDQTFQCSTAVYNPILKQYSDRKLLIDNNLYLALPPDSIVYFRLSDNLICKGWDNTLVQQRYHPLLVFYDDVNRVLQQFKKDYNNSWSAMNTLKQKTLLFSEWHKGKMFVRLRNQILRYHINQLNNSLLNLANSRLYTTYFTTLALYNYECAALYSNATNALQLLRYIDKQLLKIWSVVATDAEAYRKESEIIDYRLIKERNRSAFPLFKEVSISKTFSFFGRRHLVNENSCEDGKCFEVGEDQPQHELHEILKQKPHAIMIPR